LGLALALLTAGFWATLPVALKLSLEALDAYTLTWVRFAFAALFTLGLLAWRGTLGQFRGLRSGHRLLLSIAAAGLIGNYLGYLIGLAHTTPANAQLLIQSAPLLLALGAIVVFREPVGRGQVLGYLVIALGLGAFFLDQRASAGNPGRYPWGGLLIVLAAASWAVYALAQKQLLLRLSSQAVLLVIYLAASLVLWPLAEPRTLLNLALAHGLAVAYCALNTVGAYGAFAAALDHWQAARVSAILALTPLLTIATVWVCHLAFPHWIAPERLGLLGIVGALAVVGGSVLASLSGQQRERREEAVPGAATTAAAIATETSKPGG
jgi:drug/metabolite transporter (DMT)-like permease